MSNYSVRDEQEQNCNCHAICNSYLKDLSFHRNKRYLWEEFHFLLECCRHPSLRSVFVVCPNYSTHSIVVFW